MSTFALTPDRQFYQTDLKPGRFYRLVEFRTRKGVEYPERFQLVIRDNRSMMEDPVILDASVSGAVVFYACTAFPEYKGDELDKHRGALHRVVYGDTVGWLDGRWVLEEET